MKKIRKILLIVFILFGSLALWYWADREDYFKADYKNLTASQQKSFEWQAGDNGEKLMQRYRHYSFDTRFSFPRQKVTEVKLFQNIPMINVFTSKNLKKDYVDSFLHFCNDTTNFSWSETTCESNESEYYCRLYNGEGKVVGKIYFCLNDCGMTFSKPFSPAMKFGSLSAEGLTHIKQFLSDKTKWE